MNKSIIFGLLNNAALLLMLGLVYDTFIRQKQSINFKIFHIVSGVIIGCLAVLLMATPIRWQTGIIFDTRTILIGLTGLFFGSTPTIITIVIATIYRVIVGGSGMITGIATIISSGFIGLLWRHYRLRESDYLSKIELYVFGVVVHSAMILCMFFLPDDFFYDFMKNLALPVIIIYPIATTILGMLLGNNQRRQKIEKDLQESEDRLRTLFNESPFGIVVVDPETLEIAHFNLVACRSLGYEAAEFAKLRVPDYKTGEELEQIKKRSEQVVKLGGVSYETVHRAKDGELRNVMVNLKYITVGGKPMVQSIYRDITEEKRRRWLLELYQYALDNARDQLFLTDHTSRFLFVNNAACESLGYSRDELLHMGVDDVDPNFPADVWDDHWRTLSDLGHMSIETCHRAKDGRVYPVEIGMKHIVFDEAEYIIAIARDLTERRQQEAEKLEMERRLLHSQKLESLGVLAGGIAHDFNNILMSIVGNADLALMRMSPESPAVENIKKIEHATTRASDLARQMLAYSGKGKFMVESLNLNRLLEEMIHMLEVSISKKAVLRLNLASTLPTVEADAT